MTWYPIAFLPPQYSVSGGVAYSGAVLKAYEAQTSTVIAMATDYLGNTTATSFALNSAGYPVSGGAVIIPHVEENYKLALYPDQPSADANSGAIWTVDNIRIASGESNAFFQSFSGDDTAVLFSLSEDLGTDEKAVMVFADRKFEEYVTNGTFATDTGWTKGSGWTIAAGVATATGAISTDLTQTAAIPIIAGQSYTILFTITRSAGGVIPKIGGTTGTERTSSGTYTETLIAASTQALTFSGNGFTGTVDTVTVHRPGISSRQILRPDEYTINGTALTFDEAPGTGVNNILVFAPSLIFATASAAVDAAEAAQAAAEAAAAAAAIDAAAADVDATTAATAADDAETARDAAIAAAAGASLGNIIALTTATPVLGDFAPWADVSDSDNPKKATHSTLSDLYATKTHTYTGAQLASETTLTSTSNSIAIDLSANNDFKHTFTENTTLANPTNAIAGQSGAIRLTQHASSPKTLAFGSNYKFAGGTVPSVTATNSAADTLYYYVRSSTFIECNLVKGFA